MGFPELVRWLDNWFNQVIYPTIHTRDTQTHTRHTHPHKYYEYKNMHTHCTHIRSQCTHTHTKLTNIDPVFRLYSLYCCSFSVYSSSELLRCFLKRHKGSLAWWILRLGRRQQADRQERNTVQGGLHPSESFRKIKNNIKDFKTGLASLLHYTYLRQTTAITTIATMTTRPADAEPTMRGSWSCTDFWGSPLEKSTNIIVNTWNVPEPALGVSTCCEWHRYLKEMLTG